MFTLLSIVLCSFLTAIFLSSNIPFSSSFKMALSWFMRWLRMSTSCCNWVRSDLLLSPSAFLLVWISVFNSLQAALKR